MIAFSLRDNVDAQLFTMYSSGGVQANKIPDFSEDTASTKIMTLSDTGIFGWIAKDKLGNGNGGTDGLEIDNKGTSTTLQFSTDDNKYYIISATGTRNIYINNAAGDRARTFMIELASSSTAANRTINWYYGTSGTTHIPLEAWQDGVDIPEIYGTFKYIITVTNSGTGSDNLRISFLRMPR